MTKPAEERFWAKIDKSGDCWLWTAGKAYNGYGRLKINGKVQKAHRVSYELHHGEIPEGLHVLHHCDVRNCVNPDHLFIGTHQDNMKDRDEKGRHVALKGEASGSAIFCEADVLLIRDLAETKTQQEIADWFGVSQTHIGRIINRKRWAHLRENF